MPTGVVTVTSTVPVPAGLSAVIEVSLTTVRFVAGVVPKSTVVAPVKLVPSDRHQGGAALGTAGRAQARDHRRSGRRVGELISRCDSRYPRRCRHGHVHDAGASGAVGGDRGVVDHGEIRCGCVAEVDHRGTGEVGPPDRHQRGAGFGSAGRAQAHDCWRREDRPVLQPFNSRPACWGPLVVVVPTHGKRAKLIGEYLQGVPSRLKESFRIFWARTRPRPIHTTIGARRSTRRRTTAIAAHPAED